MAVAYLAGCGTCIALYLRDVTTSRRLCAAVTSGEATRAAVPPPGQIENVTRQAANPLVVLASLHVVTGALVVPVFGYSLVSGGGSAAEVTVFWISLVGTALAVGLGLLARRLLNPAHERRREVLAGHWAPSDEGNAWAAARRVAGRGGSTGDADVDRRVSTGLRLIVLGGFLGSLGGFALQVTLFIRFPGSTTVAGAQLGDRAEYSAGVEQTLDLGLWVFSAGMVLGLLVIVAGLLMDGFGRQAERKGLRRALKDPAHPRPANALLARHAERQSSRFAQVCAGVAGVALVLGAGTLVVGYGGGLGSETFYAGYRRVATITVAVAVLLFVVALVANGWMNMRNGGLRNDLIRRWPTPPEVNPNQEGMVVRARVGAALRGSRMKKAGWSSP